MIFRDAAQRGEVCFVLTAWVNDSPYFPWYFDKTSDYFVPSRKENPGWSTSERAMVDLALALWSGGEILPVWLGFDSRRMRDIAELLTAMSAGDSPEAIDRWIRERSKPLLGVASAGWEIDVRRRSRA